MPVSLINSVSTVGDQCSALDERRLGGAKEENAVGYLFWCASPVHRSDRDCFPDLVVDEWCFDDAGTYAVDPNVVCRVVQSI